MAHVPTNQGFCSILWLGAADDRARDDVAEPACFHDLNLDQLVAAITSTWPAENLVPFFRTPLRACEQVTHRQAVLRDLERAPLRQAFECFTQGLRNVRTGLDETQKRHYHYEKERGFLGAADVYCNTVQTLDRSLQRLQPQSPGLRTVAEFVRDYLASEIFITLAKDTRACLSRLDEVRYGLVVRTNSVTVCPIEDEADASVDIEATFARFRSDKVGDSGKRSGRIGFKGLNHIEAQLLDKVALLHPEPFAALDTFCTTHGHFIDATLARLAREACFYLAWLACIDPLRKAALPFCFPTVSAESKTVEAEDAFDVALARLLLEKRQHIVRNDFALRAPERVMVVTGPNHGGKTTFARVFGQLHWLAALGLTVPGTHARLFLCDRLCTHFEREETIASLRGKLQDDLVRIHTILEQATPRSVIIINEIFASTTLDDALQLGRRILARIAELDALAVCVTFLTELSRFDEKTVSMVAGIDPDDPAIRTFKVERRPADGLAYALAVARKYGVTREALLERITP